MKKTVTLSGSAADKKLYKEAMKCASSKTLLSYKDANYPVIFAGKIGGKMTLVLLVDKKAEKPPKAS